MAKHVLIMGKGKNKRQWELTDAQFQKFEEIFEECETVDLSDFNPKEFKITLVSGNLPK